MSVANILFIYSAAGSRGEVLVGRMGMESPRSTQPKPGENERHNLGAIRGVFIVVHTSIFFNVIMLHNVLHLGEHGPLAPISALDFVPFFESKHYPDGAWLARVALLIYKIWGPVCTSDLELS